MARQTRPQTVRHAHLGVGGRLLFGLILIASANRLSAQVVERGEEFVVYYHCERMINENTKAVTQNVRVVTNWEITVLADGRRLRDNPIGNYAYLLENRFKARGAMRCEQRDQPGYSAPPGTSFEAWGPRTISVVSEPVDPSLFVIPQFKGHIRVFSLDGQEIGENPSSQTTTKPASATRPSPAIIVETSPPPKSEAQLRAERADRLDTAVRKTLETVRAEPSWQEARKRRRGTFRLGPASIQ